jgi:hypothetical protein
LAVDFGKYALMQDVFCIKESKMDGTRNNFYNKFTTKTDLAVYGIP